MTTGEQTSTAKSSVDLANTPIAELVADYPRLEPVLSAYGLDTCCGGHFTPVQAAAEHHLDSAPLLEALRAALEQ